MTAELFKTRAMNLKTRKIISSVILDFSMNNMKI